MAIPSYERETDDFTQKTPQVNWRRVGVTWGGALLIGALGMLVVLGGVHVYQDHQNLHAIQGWVEGVIRAQQQGAASQQKPPDKQP